RYLDTEFMQPGMSRIQLLGGYALGQNVIDIIVGQLAVFPRDLQQSFDDLRQTRLFRMSVRCRGQFGFPRSICPFLNVQIFAIPANPGSTLASSARTVSPAGSEPNTITPPGGFGLNGSVPGFGIERNLHNLRFAGRAGGPKPTR